MTHLKRLSSAALLVAALLAAACSESDTTDGNGTGAAAGTGGAGGAGSGGSAGGGAGGGAGSAGKGGAGGSGGVGGTGGGGGTGGSAGTAGSAGSGGSGETGTLTGVVTRSADIPSGLDGIGTVYIGVYDESPLANQQATPVGSAILENADLSSDSAEVEYSIANLPVGVQLYIVPFQDDDGNASATNPVPAKPDLVGIDGLGPITVTLEDSGETEEDLDLNTEVPL